MSTNKTFRERLELGQNKEAYVNDILNLCGIKSISNNKVVVTDMDLYLPDDDIYVDVKYLEASFDETAKHPLLTTDNCLIMKVEHLRNYEKKRKKTNKDTWVAFLINFAISGVYELRFIRTEDIYKLEFEKERAFRKEIKDGSYVLNLIRTDCLNMNEFLNYLKSKRDQK